ncbi:GNAT family N-acetyltransferase [Roseomonas sp. HF4]|uniref:GNAT family N-acetyltransferase n=1 Tax=Roseomonas sp. HF4 TaxID=2562313 RepID=UPI0010BF98FC|nr:N-acetyltransferase [Roseomonas sp. HF4]
MQPGVVIRPAAETDDLAALYAAAFPREDLVPLVRALAGRGDVLSIVALAGDDLAGHVAFTRCRVTGRADSVALLGPLAVAPARQRQGIGGALLREGLRRLAAEGVARVLVLGDPAYYGRFGFRPDAAVAPPIAGTLDVPAPWRDRALWGA